MRPPGIWSSTAGWTSDEQGAAHDGKRLSVPHPCYPELAAAGLWSTPTDIAEPALAIRSLASADRTFLSALFSAVAQGLVIVLGMAGTLLYWTVSGVTNATWEQLVAVLTVVAVGLAGVLRLPPDVTVLSLGGEAPVGLGQRPGVVWVAATLLVLLLTGGAVAAAGPVAVVGLVLG